MEKAPASRAIHALLQALLQDVDRDEERSGTKKKAVDRVIGTRPQKAFKDLCTPDSSASARKCSSQNIGET